MVGSAVEVIAAAGRVMIDVKVEHDDATGLRHRDHAFAGVVQSRVTREARLTLPGRVMAP